MSAASATSGTPAFDERLSVPWWWYLPAIGVGVLLGAEVHLGYPGVRSWLGYVVAVPLLVGALMSLGRARVQVDDHALRVGPARYWVFSVREPDGLLAALPGGG